MTSNPSRGAGKHRNLVCKLRLGWIETFTGSWSFQRAPEGSEVSLLSVRLRVRDSSTGSPVELAENAFHCSALYVS